jgi:hypothetical protein
MDKASEPQEHGRMLRWLPSLLWAGVIFAGSSVPGTNIPGGYSVYGHLGEYFVLGALALWAARREDRRTVLLILALCALYGASDEFHQAFVPFRTPDPVDWLTDVVGAAAGVSVFLWWTVRRRRKNGARQ